MRKSNKKALSWICFSLGRTLRPCYHLNSKISLCTLPVRDLINIRYIIRYCFPFNGGNSDEAYLSYVLVRFTAQRLLPRLMPKSVWSDNKLLLSIQSLLPPRRFPPTIFSLCIWWVCTSPYQRFFSVLTNFCYYNRINYRCQQLFYVTLLKFY